MRPEQILDRLWELLEKELRSKNADGISQEKLATTIGVSQNTISMWLKGDGRKNARIINILRMLCALGVSMDDLAKTLFEPEQLAARLIVLDKNPEALDQVSKIIEAGGAHYDSLIKMIGVLYDTLPKKD